jgi:histidine triad (HIT) family protein
MISKEEAESIRKRLLEQVSKLPEEQHSQAIEQIESMADDQLERFLNQSAGGQCVFCSIISGQVNSYPIYEDDNIKAVLEINPLSYGHIMVIPRTHINSMDFIQPETFSVIKDIAAHMKSILNADEVQISTKTIFEHFTIHLIPKYSKNKSNLPESGKLTEEEFKILQEKLSYSKDKYQKQEESEEEFQEPEIIYDAPRRIP